MEMQTDYEKKTMHNGIKYVKNAIPWYKVIGVKRNNTVTVKMSEIEFCDVARIASVTAKKKLSRNGSVWNEKNAS